MFRIWGILILLVFYGCYFVKQISQKKKGIRTDQLGKGKTGFARGIEITLKAVTYLVPVIEAVSIAVNAGGMPVWVKTAGAFLAAAGTAVFVTAVIQMGESWRAGVSEGDRTDLVTDGIFSISRNPAFLGFDLVYIGMLLLFFSWPLFAASLFAVLLFHLQIVNVEEDFLAAAFGARYLVYRRRVNRYIGRTAAYDEENRASKK